MRGLERIFPAVRRWPLVALAMVVGCAAAFGAASLQSRRYRSDVGLFVSARYSAVATDAIASAYAGAQFTSAIVQSYVEIADSAAVLAPAIASLHLHETVADLAREVVASNPPNTVLINLSVTTGNPSGAQRLAATIARNFIALVSKLESGPNAASPVRVHVTSPATFSSTPTSPSKKLDLALGLVMGSLVGLGVATALESVDDSVTTEDDISGLGLTYLAHVPLDSTASAGLLSLSSKTAAPRLEALRTLRTALNYVSVDSPPRCIVVASCEAGSGKSVTASTLAAVMAAEGRRVAVVEGDLRRPQLRSYMNARASEHGVADVLALGLDVANAMVPVDNPLGSRGSLDVLVAGHPVPDPSELLGSQRMRRILGDLKRAYDIVIVDAPPLLLVTDGAVLAAASDGVVLVVEYGRTPRHDLRRASATLQQVSARVLGVVVNKAKPSPSSYYYTVGFPLIAPELTANSYEEGGPPTAESTARP